MSFMRRGIVPLCIIGIVLILCIPVILSIVRFQQTSKPLSPQARAIWMGDYDRSVGLAWALRSDDPELIGVSMVALARRSSQLKQDEAVAILVACAPPTRLDETSISFSFQIIEDKPKQMLEALETVLSSGEISCEDEGVCEYLDRLLAYLPDSLQASDRFRSVRSMMDDCP